MELEEKTMAMNEMRNQLIANYEFLQKWYLEMCRRLDDKRASILGMREEWLKQVDDIKDMVKLDGEVIPLNVGGTHHLMTERDVLTLCKGSTLEAMFSGMHDLKKINEEVFLDRDGATFLNVVNYLRNNREVFPEFNDRNDELHFFKELDFWRIPTREQDSAYVRKLRMDHSYRDQRIKEIEQNVRFSKDESSSHLDGHNTSGYRVIRETHQERSFTRNSSGGRRSTSASRMQAP